MIYLDTCTICSVAFQPSSLSPHSEAGDTENWVRLMGKEGRRLILGLQRLQSSSFLQDAKGSVSCWQRVDGPSSGYFILLSFQQQSLFWDSGTRALSSK